MSNSWHPDEEQLLAFADGELDPAHSATVDEHARSCDACRQQIAAFRAIGLRHWVAGLDPCNPAKIEEFSKVIDILDRS